MELLVALCVGVLVSCGVYLLLRPSTFPVVVGLTFLSYAVNTFLLATGGLKVGKAVILQPGISDYADPLPQALVLTAIVIAFAMTAFVIVLALKLRDVQDSDYVNSINQRLLPAKNPQEFKPKEPSA